MSTSPFHQFFLTSHSQDQFKESINEVAKLLIDHATEKAHSNTSLDLKLINSIETQLTPQNFDIFPKIGISMPDVLKEIHNFFLKNYIHVTDTKTMAHLHCPPILPCVITELIVAATNQSMDSWDQCGTAGTIEEYILRFLGDELIGYPSSGSGGTFTTGGTQANMMGLLIARNVFALKHGVDLQKSGITPTITKFRIFCSEDAHFTIDQSAAILGLGLDSIIKVPSHNGKIRTDILRTKIVETRTAGYIPFCISATAGTTDFGAIDDLSILSQIAKSEGLWFHVDAAYGGGLLFAHPAQRKLLEGIQHADSIGLDFHKMLYVPIPCGVFMMKDKKHFETIRTSAVYLNPENDEVMGFQNLVYKSLLTTRRFDALKAYVALRVVGRQNYANMIGYTTGLANRVAKYIDEVDDDVELAIPQSLSTVVFRFHPKSLQSLNLSLKQWNDINYHIRNKMIEKGGGIIAQTTFQQKTYLKFTILNPLITYEDVMGVLASVKKFGFELVKEQQIKQQSKL
eukprot:TRINITY_DN3697_c0_g1_i1.p1 TRINITY_DN3697_c0_g1~~TRINITY_DN3697_c0_g1_i1.p1  ORF type:complete len:536 (+),score=105.36 TRINITY_DN3697_c0_g1_i1:67-1608(+)